MTESERGDVMTADVTMEIEAGVLQLLALKTKEGNEPRKVAASRSWKRQGK